MSTVDKYFEFVSIWTLLFALAGGVIFLLLVPRKSRLAASLGLMSAMLLPAIMPSLGAFNAFAKGSILGLYGLVAFAAFLDPTPRRRLPFIAWCYIGVALLSFIYIVTVRDTGRAYVIRFEWLLLVISALLTARVATDQAALERILRGIGYGFLCGLALSSFALVTDPRGAFSDVSRFAPYGGNPLQSGLTFAAAVPILFYLSLRTQSNLMRPVWLYSSLVSALFVVIGISRSIYGVTLICSLPLVLAMARRVRFAIMTVLLMAAAAYFVFTHSINLQYDRIFSLQSERWSLISVYTTIAERRPIFGLLGTQGFSAEKSDEYSTYAHNAYLSQLYLGGLSYLVPLFILAMYSVWCSLRVWWYRARCGFDPLVISVLICMLAAMYLQGFTDVEIYFPAYTWAWLHIFIAVFMMSVNSDLSWRRRTAEAEFFMASAEAQASYG